MTRLARWIGRTLSGLARRITPFPLDAPPADRVRVAMVRAGVGEPEVIVLASLPDGSTAAFTLAPGEAREVSRMLRDAALIARKCNP